MITVAAAVVVLPEALLVAGTVLGVASIAAGAVDTYRACDTKGSRESCGRNAVALGASIGLGRLYGSAEAVGGFAGPIWAGAATFGIKFVSSYYSLPVALLSRKV